MTPLYKFTQADAQAVADACHQYKIAHDLAYAASVAAGHTTAWSHVQQVGTWSGGVFTAASPAQWQLFVNPSVKGALSAADQAAAGL